MAEGLAQGHWALSLTRAGRGAGPGSPGKSRTCCLWATSALQGWLMPPPEMRTLDSGPSSRHGSPPAGRPSRTATVPSSPHIFQGHRQGYQVCPTHGRTLGGPPENPP